MVKKSDEDLEFGKYRTRTSVKDQIEAFEEKTPKTPKINKPHTIVTSDRSDPALNRTRSKTDSTDLLSKNTEMLTDLNIESGRQHHGRTMMTPSLQDNDDQPQSPDTFFSRERGTFVSTKGFGKNQLAGHMSKTTNKNMMMTD